MVRRIVLVAAIVIPVLAACSERQTGPVLELTLAEWSIRAPESTTPGEFIWRITNNGVLLHEVVIIATATDPGSLPTDDGTVDPARIDGTVIAEVAEVTAGHRAEAPISLEPGDYVLICNVAGHYESGMHRRLVVRPATP